MTGIWKAHDERFFDEWKHRRPGQRRSLRRAQAVVDALGLAGFDLPLATVVGSKGKGTAATFAAAVLSATGHRTALVTSPGLVENNERIRLDGRSAPDELMTELGRMLVAARETVGPPLDGYLSPTGSYTIAGVLAASRTGADALVLEEGLGGSSDEVSLFAPLVVGVTPVFREHADLLGGSLEAIVRDLLGVVRPTTQVVVSSPQSEDVLALLREIAGDRLVVIDEVAANALPDIVQLPYGLSRWNALVGIEVGRALAAIEGWSTPPGALAATLDSVVLQGRLSHHTGHGGAEWIVDGAISPAGVSGAVQHALDRWGRIDTVLASFPDTKDVEACYHAVPDGLVVPVLSGISYLHFESPAHPQPPVALAEAAEAADQQGRHVLALGTISFVGELLAWLGVRYPESYVVRS